MATFETRIKDLATRIASQCKADRTLINGNTTDNTALKTTVKTSLLASINELYDSLQQVSSAAGARIDDQSVASGTNTYSVTKILQLLTDAKAAVKNDILGGASAAYDTLGELQALLEGKGAEIAAIMTGLGNRLRIDADQGLTAAQKLAGRTNLDVYSKDEIGNPDTNFVATFVAGL